MLEKMHKIAMNIHDHAHNYSILNSSLQAVAY